MTDDLVVRLRCYPANRLCRQVADALEAKNARIAELEQMVAVLMRHEARDDTIKVQRARIEELEAALKPFADCKIWDGYRDDEPYYPELKTGDLRAARKALGEKHDNE